MDRLGTGIRLHVDRTGHRHRQDSGQVFISEVKFAGLLRCWSQRKQENVQIQPQVNKNHTESQRNQTPNAKKSRRENIPSWSASNEAKPKSTKSQGRIHEESRRSLKGVKAQKEPRLHVLLQGSRIHIYLYLTERSEVERKSKSKRCQQVRKPARSQTSGSLKDKSPRRVQRRHVKRKPQRSQNSNESRLHFSNADDGPVYTTTPQNASLSPHFEHRVGFSGNGRNAEDDTVTMLGPSRLFRHR